MDTIVPTRAPAVSAEVLERHDRPGPRYTSYPTADRFHDGYGEAAYEASLAAAARGEGPLSLYLHLPFCEHRCLYCACNVVITRSETVANPYLERLKREIELVAARLGGRRRVAQLHLGGGTPTWYAPAPLADLVRHLKRHFDLDADAEASLEVDPRVTSEAHLEALAAEGFDRMSLGVQDFDPVVQEAVRRVQSVEETRALMERGRELGFASINLDLIYGLPHQTPASFRRTLRRVVELRPDRLAVYSFAHVPWLKHHQKLLPTDALPTGRAKYELLVIAREELGAAGYLDVGMDHFARPDDALALAQADGRLSRNFMGYTTVRANDLIGFGLSAIGQVAGAFAQNTRKLSAYERAIDAGRLPVARGYALTPDDQVRQEVIREWMCHFSVDKAAVGARHGIEFDAYFAAELDALRPLAEEGFVHLGEGRLEAGELGRVFPRNVAMLFDRHLREARTEGARFSRTV